MYLYFFLLATFSASVSAAKLPSFFKACSGSDPNVDRCVEDAIRNGGPLFTKGIPELNIPSLDPGKLDTININNPSLNVTIIDGVLTGLADFKLNSVHLNVNKGKLSLNFSADPMLNAHYIMDGQVLILPIKGDGEAKIKFSDVSAAIKIDIKIVDNYWTITNYKTSYKIGHAHFNFTNLFGGNKELADVTLQFINDNWKEIVNEIAPPAIEQIIKHIVDNVKILASVVPAPELILA